MVNHISSINFSYNQNYFKGACLNGRGGDIKNGIWMCIEKDGWNFIWEGRDYYFNQEKLMLGYSLLIWELKIGKWKEDTSIEFLFY